MKSERHWEASKTVDAYHTANQVAQSMMEHAKSKGMDHKGIKVMSRKDAHYSGHRHVDSMIMWDEGPFNWAYLTEVNAENVMVVPTSGTTLTFYQMERK